MKILAVKCKICNDIIYSRAQHDFHWCSCKNIAVDGGFEYNKITFKNFSDLEEVEIEVNVSKKELYNDWNLNENKYGIVR